MEFHHRPWACLPLCLLGQRGHIAQCRCCPGHHCTRVFVERSSGISEICSRSHKRPRIAEPPLFSARKGLPSLRFSLRSFTVLTDVRLHPAIWSSAGLVSAAFPGGPGCQGPQREAMLMHDAWAVNQQPGVRWDTTNFVCAGATQHSPWQRASIWMRLLHPVRMTPKREQTDNPVIWQRSAGCQQKGSTDAFSFLQGRDAYLYVSVTLWVNTFGTSETSFQGGFECRTSHSRHWLGKQGILMPSIYS